MRYRFTKDEIIETNNHDGSFELAIWLDGKRHHMLYIGYPRKIAYQKFQQEFGNYPDDYQPLATLCMCNFGGIAVMEVQYGINDYVIVCDNYGDGYKNITKNMIHYNTKGDYFVRNGQRYYLQGFMRTR